MSFKLDELRMSEDQFQKTLDQIGSSDPDSPSDDESILLAEGLFELFLRSTEKEALETALSTLYNENGDEDTIRSLEDRLENIYNSNSDGDLYTGNESEDDNDEAPQVDRQGRKVPLFLPYKKPIPGKRTIPGRKRDKVKLVVVRPAVKPRPKKKVTLGLAALALALLGLS